MSTVAAPRLVWREAHLAVPSAVAERRLAPVLLAVVILVGCALRLVGLERVPLRNDELNHYYVAQALERGDNPVLPSGEWYLRGIDFTRAVQFSLRHVSPVERAVRLPSAVAGCFGLVLFAAITWLLGGVWTAVYGTLLFALYPEAIHQARTGRFYTVQLMFGLVALYAGWLALRAGEPRRKMASLLAGQWAWMLVTVAAFLLAARVQVVTLSVALAWGTAVAATAVADARAWKVSAVRWSAPVQLCLLALLAAGLFVATRPHDVQFLIVRALAIPHWARASGFDDVTYIHFLAANLPVALGAGAASLYWVARRRTALGLYLLTWFLLPFVLHSLLPFKSIRFILLALPALLISVAIAASDLLGALWTAVHRRFERRRLPPLLPRLAAGAIVTVVGLSALLPTPAFTRALWPLGAYEVSGWQETLALVRALPAGREMPLGHSMPLPALHYWGRLDFTVNEGAREQWLTRERKRAQLGVDEPGGYVWLPMGSPDMYVGAPVLTVPAAIRDHYQDMGAVLIGLDSRTLVLDGVRGELYDTLRVEAEELCQGRCGPMLLYLWRFNETAGSRGAD